MIMKNYCFFRSMSPKMLLAALVFCCAALMPTSVKAQTATSDSPVMFHITCVMVAGEMTFNINVDDVYAPYVYQSWTITYPNELQINIPAGITTNWNDFPLESGETKSVTFIIKTGDRSAALLKTDLESVYFTLDDSNVFPPEGSKVSISAFPTKVIYFKDEDEYAHWYTFVNWGGSPMNWIAAYNDAKTQFMQDPRYPNNPSMQLQGYLATITSQEEQRQVFNAIAVLCGWLGGTRMVHNSGKAKIQDELSLSTTIGNFDLTTTYGTEWYWADGPEAWTVYDPVSGKYSYYPKGWTEVLPGTVLSDGVSLDPNIGKPVLPLVFWKNPTYAVGIDHRPTSSDGLTKVYANFNNPFGINYLGTAGGGTEPNNSSTEYVLQFAYASGDLWNDYRYDNTGSMFGYYVEFGGYPGDPKADELGGSGITTFSEVELVMPVIIQYRSRRKTLRIIFG